MQVEDLVRELRNKALNGQGVNHLQLHNGIDLISRISEFILGILAVLIITVLPLIVTLEIIYINFPIVRGQLDNVRDRGTGHFKKAVEFSLRDAIKAVEQANTVQTGKSANFIYLVLKIKWICLVVFAISIVLGGGELIISILMSLLSGLLDVLVDTIVV